MALTLKTDGMKKLNTFWQHIRWGQGLVHIIVQNGADGVVLTSARLNREALMRNITTGTINLFSLTKNILRMKGESSMHYQYIENLSFDCDYDAALIVISTKTTACHNNKRVCFHNSLGGELFTIIEHTIKCLMGREGSYAYGLVYSSMNRIIKKVYEEVTELSLSLQDPEYLCVTKEVSDICFHILVLLLALNIDPGAIILELKTRTLFSGIYEKKNRNWKG